MSAAAPHPVICFGLDATAVAMLAMQGRVDRHDVARLVARADRLGREDLRAAVARFADQVHDDPGAAGRALRDAVIALAHDLAPVEISTRFDWTQRADCGHG